MKREKSGDSTFELLKGMLEEQSNMVKDINGTVQALNTSVQLMSKDVKSILKKDDEQDRRIEKNEERVRVVELAHKGCNADVMIKGMGREIGEMKNWKSTVDAAINLLRSNNDIDTGMVDVEKQRILHAAEIAIQDKMSWKVPFFKYLPWIVLIFALGMVLATIITIQVITGKDYISKINIMDVRKK